MCTYIQELLVEAYGVCGFTGPVYGEGEWDDSLYERVFEEVEHGYTGRRNEGLCTGPE